MSTRRTRVALLGLVWALIGPLHASAQSDAEAAMSTTPALAVPGEELLIRYRTDAPITSGNWATATQATGEPAPSLAGTSERGQRETFWDTAALVR